MSKRRSPNAIRPVLLAAFAVLMACSTSTAPNETTQSSALVPTSKQQMDPLDVLPSRAGELQIKNAWRVSANGVDLVNGQYEWEGSRDQFSWSPHFTDVQPFRSASWPGAEHTSQVATDSSSASSMAALISGVAVLER